LILKFTSQISKRKIVILQEKNQCTILVVFIEKKKIRSRAGKRNLQTNVKSPKRLKRKHKLSEN